MLCKDLAMHEPDRWYSRDLSAYVWTGQVAEKRPVRPCIGPDRWQSRDLSGNALGQTGGRVETCQAMHEPDRWQSRDLSAYVWTGQVVE
jgi:hypothetical protein